MSADSIEKIADEMDACTAYKMRDTLRDWSQRLRSLAAGREGQPVAEVSCRPMDEPRFEALRAVEGLPFGTHKLYTHPATKSDESVAIAEVHSGQLRWLVPDDDQPSNCLLYAHPAKADDAADWVCVPREPTEEMCRALEMSEIGPRGTYKSVWSPGYAAMLAASPARVGEGE